MYIFAIGKLTISPTMKILIVVLIIFAFGIFWILYDYCLKLITFKKKGIDPTTIVERVCVLEKEISDLTKKNKKLLDTGSVLLQEKEILQNQIIEINEQLQASIFDTNEKARIEIGRITTECKNLVDKEKEKAHTANVMVANVGNDYISFIKTSIDQISLQISSLEDEVANSPLDNNHKNIAIHLSQKFHSFHLWFVKCILEDQKTKKRSAREIEELIRETLLQALTNNYSWISELSRFYAYTSINRTFTEELRKNYVPIDYVKSSYIETCAFLGKLGITLFLPLLFIDDFNEETHKVTNTPLINSYFPQGFVEYRAENRGLIYDMLRPGYSINGEVKQLPEVCVF